MRRRDFLPALAVTAAGAQTPAPAGGSGRLKQCVTRGVFGRGMNFEDSCREAANAGANDVEDHLALLDLALEQLPPSAVDGEILARSDSAGASHDLADACREHKINAVVGLPVRDGDKLYNSAVVISSAGRCPIDSRRSTRN